MKVYVRTGTYKRAARIDELFTLTATERHLGLGTWTLSAPLHLPAVAELLALPRSGIEIADAHGRRIFGGPMTGWDIIAAGGVETVEAHGVDDMDVLAVGGRLGHHDPLDPAPPYTAAHDTLTGPASTVLWQLIDRNAGPGALEARRWPGLTLTADPAEGPTITESVRMRPLLDVVADIAGPAGMSVTVRGGGGGVVATVRASRNRSGTVISEMAGTLEEYRLGWRAPTMTAGYAGGSGELDARIFAAAAVTPPATYPVRLERFLDHRHLDDATELARKLDDALVEGAEQTSLSFTPTEALAARYRVDFDLGDLVTVVVRGQRMLEPVTSATVKIDGAKVSRSFTVGREKATGPAVLFDDIRRLAAQQRRAGSS